MYTAETVTRLYEACGFAAKPYMVARLLRTDTSVENLSVPPVSFDLASHNSIAHERKMWRAARIARVLACLPFVRGIAVCNSLALGMVHEESDIDLFIIAALGRVWSARWFVTGLLAVARLRPGEARRDPVCVSFYIDESVTDLSHVMIDRDVYFFYWLRSLLPLLGTHPLFENASHTAPEFRVGGGAWRTRVRVALEFFARAISEKFVRSQQEKIMPEDIKQAAEKKDTCVVLGDAIIKLHMNDRRVEIRDNVFKNV